MELHKWVYITYLVDNHVLKLFYDGEEVNYENIPGNVVGNTGPLYIGKDPWYNGVVGAGFDNIQIHNRALSTEEIKQAASGQILFNDNLVLAFDFADGIVDGKVKDLSRFGHDATVHGNPKMAVGGPPKTEYEAPEYSTDPEDTDYSGVD
jgi:hypothetical protein